MRRLLCALIGAALAGTVAARSIAIDAVPAEQLPVAAHETLRLIDAGGPFPYRRDGIAFQNRERRLPLQPGGYYREYTVPAPGFRDRGPRRIVAGGKPPVVFYYTADHYKSFRRIQR